MIQLVKRRHVGFFTALYRAACPLIYFFIYLLSLPSSSHVAQVTAPPINTHMAHVHSCAPSLCGKVSRVAETGAGLQGSEERWKDASGFYWGCLSGEATPYIAQRPSPGLPSHLPQLCSENTVNHQSSGRGQWVFAPPPPPTPPVLLTLLRLQWCFVFIHSRKGSASFSVISRQFLTSFAKILFFFFLRFLVFFVSLKDPIESRQTPGEISFIGQQVTRVS